MDLEIKKDLTSNWFKMLQDAIWHTIVNLGIEVKKETKVVENLEF